jgi:hypothetical protein
MRSTRAWLARTASGGKRISPKPGVTYVLVLHRVKRGARNYLPSRETRWFLGKKLVSHNFASWNQLERWLRGVAALQSAA